MANYCAQCGNKLKEGAGFCSKCGAKVKTGVQMMGSTGTTRAGIPSQTTENSRKTGVNKTEELAGKINAEKNKSAVSKKKLKKDGRNVLCIILAAVLLVELVIAGFKYPGFFKKGNGDNTVSTGTDIDIPVRNDEELTWEMVSSDNVLMPAQGGSVTAGEVTVTSAPENLSGDQVLQVTDYGTQTINGEEIHRFDVSLGEHRQFETPVAVTFSVSKAEDEDIALLHYDEDLGEWIPLAAEYDEENGTVTGYFSSLSPTEVRKEKSSLHTKLYYIEYGTNEYGEKTSRNAQMKVSKYYWSVLSRLDPEKLSDEALKFVADPELYAQNFEKYRDSYNRDKTAAFNESSLDWTVAGPALDICNGLLQHVDGFRYTDIDYSDAFGNALGYVGLIMAAYQAYLDFQNAGGDLGALQAPAKNLYTNLFTNSGSIYSLATGYSSIGFSLAFVGVTLVAFGLDQAVEYAEESMKQRTEDVFNAYFEKVAPFDKIEWYELFREAYYQCSNDPDQATKIISDKIDSTIEKFWTDIYKEENIDILVAATEADTKNIFTKDNIYFYDVSSEEKEMLNKQMKNTLWKKYKTETMPLVNTFLIERMQESILENVSKFTEPFNEYLEFEILETVPDIETNAESAARCAGCTLAFANDEGVIKDWDVINIPEDMTDGWLTDYNCTIMGYAEGGFPNKLCVFESEEAARKGENPIFTRDFTVTFDGVTRIDFTAENETTDEEESEVQGSFPYMDTETLICSAHDGAYNYVESGKSGEFYAGRSGHFTLNPDGSFKIVIPSMTGYAKDNWQVKTHDGMTITGTFGKAEWVSTSRCMLRNGVQAGSEGTEEVMQIKCSEVTFSTSVMEIASTFDYPDDTSVVLTDRYCFKQTDSPNELYNYVNLYVSQDGTINVVISLEGEEENSWSSDDEDSDQAGSESGTNYYSYTVEGAISPEDAGTLWK